METQERLHADYEVRRTRTKEAKVRDYSFEALAEVTATDWNTGRGELNKALMLIKEQSEIEDDYLLSAEIHDRAKMYRALWPEMSLTPSALAKHWERVFEETKRNRRPSLPPPAPLPTSRREQNLEEARKLMAAMGWGKGEEHGEESELVREEVGD